MVEMADVTKIVTSVQAKSNMKAFYDWSSREKIFDTGDMVLVRRLGLDSKLSDALEGPLPGRHAGVLGCLFYPSAGKTP